jgi:hypothetical protein
LGRSGAIAGPTQPVLAGTALVWAGIGLALPAALWLAFFLAQDRPSRSCAMVGVV